MIAVVPVSKELLPRVAPVALPFLLRAAERSQGWSTKQINDRLAKDRSVLWVALDGSVMIGAFMCEIRDDVLYIALLSGVRWREWRHHVATVEEFARQSGLKSVAFEGRRGWARDMRRHGFVPYGSEVRKDLN